MLSGITITCFAGSYLVTLGLEISRLFFRLRVRWLVMILSAAAGMLAHTIYLFTLTRSELADGRMAPLSGWYDWCLIGSWVLAGAYLGLAVRRPQNTIGIFLLPLVLGLIAAGSAVNEMAPFDRQDAISYWGVIHGVMLLIGTVTAALGFAAGVMYLLQSYRLKRKLPPRPGFRLPSLEWLQRFNRRCLWISTGLLALGLLAGLVLNLVRQSTGSATVAWTDRVVVSSAILFLWLIVATMFESFYKPAREGRKVAYMTLASFVFVGLALGFVLMGQHASNSERASRRTQIGPKESAPDSRPVGQQASARKRGAR